jgi:Kef-type K+ transport system membrane component KefB
MRSCEFSFSFFKFLFINITSWQYLSQLKAESDLCLTLAAALIVTVFLIIIFVLLTSNLDVLFNKRLILGATLSVTKFVRIVMIWVTV